MPVQALSDGIAHMSKKNERRVRYAFTFDYAVSTVGIPQPYPVPQGNPQILFRYSSADTDRGERRVLNVCGNAEGLKYLAAMLLLTADSEKYDPEFHIHLDAIPGVEADGDVTIRAPVYLDVLRSGEFAEYKGESIPYSGSVAPRRSGKRKANGSRKQTRAKRK
jgi:hypothetical protein